MFFMVLFGEHTSRTFISTCSHIHIVAVWAWVDARIGSSTRNTTAAFRATACWPPRHMSSMLRRQSGHKSCSGYKKFAWTIQQTSPLRGHRDGSNHHQKKEQQAQQAQLIHTHTLENWEPRAAYMRWEDSTYTASR